MARVRKATSLVWLIVDIAKVRDALVVCRSKKRAIELLAGMNPLTAANLRLQRAEWTPIGEPEECPKPEPTFTSAEFDHDV